MKNTTKLVSADKIPSTYDKKQKSYSRLISRNKHKTCKLKNGLKAIFLTNQNTLFNFIKQCILQCIVY